jgi:hypothetical protein
MTTLAIDIGGTKIAAAVCDENDSIIQRWRVPTPMDADAINQHIAEVYREAVAAGHTDIEAIGISAAGNVSADRKTLTFSANIPAWINYDLSEHVGARDHIVRGDDLGPRLGVIIVGILCGDSGAALHQAGHTCFLQPCDDIRRQCDAGFVLRCLVEDTEHHGGFLGFSHESPFFVELKRSLLTVASVPKESTFGAFHFT